MIDDFATLLSNVGFPIAAFCAMFYMCNTTIKENTKALMDINLTIAKFINDSTNESEVQQ